MVDKPIDKPIGWCGSAYKDLTDEKTFTLNARKEAGHQLNQVQKGLDPDDWKPFDIVGPGTKEIRINLNDGWFRVMYVAKFEEAVYVLHCFKKKDARDEQNGQRLDCNAVQRIDQRKE